MKADDLKFRIWDEITKCFFYSDWKTNGEDEFEIKIIDPLGNSFKTFNIDEIEFELSLSSKDISGKDLYENDVVEYNDKLYCIINKADEFFIVNDADVKFLPTGDVLKLVGNIHENPELRKICSLAI